MHATFSEKGHQWVSCWVIQSVSPDPFYDMRKMQLISYEGPCHPRPYPSSTMLLPNRAREWKKRTSATAEGATTTTK